MGRPKGYKLNSEQLEIFRKTMKGMVNSGQFKKGFTPLPHGLRVEDSHIPKNQKGKYPLVLKERSMSIKERLNQILPVRIGESQE